MMAEALRSCHHFVAVSYTHLFEIPIQAAVGSKIIARETVRAMRKDVPVSYTHLDVYKRQYWERKVNWMPR